MNVRSELYPPIEPYNSGFLQVDGLHSVYYEESGNPQGKPAIFVHGGPGGGTAPFQRRYWDPEHYRIILFDQRGCGRSTPHAELQGNSTWDLVADMERLREHLGIERWQLLGGSWGSTLSLCYAITHPGRVSELILRGIFLVCEEDVQWFYQRGCSMLFPDAWDEFAAILPEDERSDVVGAYYKRLTAPDEALRRQAGVAWSVWEGRTSRLEVDPELVRKSADPYFADAFARIECHYFVNKGFLACDRWILRETHRLAAIPTFIVHGRYDVVCPPKNAWELKKVMPHAELVFTPTSGHSGMELQNQAELVKAAERFK